MSPPELDDPLPAVELERAGRGFRGSLRLKALALVLFVNAVVFGTCALVLLVIERDEAIEDRQEQERLDRELLELLEPLVRSLRDTIQPDGLNVANILLWPSWSKVDDALIVDSKLASTEFGPTAAGIALNPVGIAGRRFDFDRSAVLYAMLDAMESGSYREVAGGRAVPIVNPDGDGLWGGVWYRVKAGTPRRALVGQLVPWFLVSTLVLTLVTFFSLRQLVLDPLRQLALAAGEVRRGNFSIQLVESGRRDELAELIHGFNEMTRTVGRFNQRLSEEVARATEKARAAEAAAMTQRRLAAMGELAAGIAHEINNPLGGLQNAVEALGNPDLAEERRSRYLELLSSGLTRIGETVHRLRRFTPREAEREVVPLGAVARDAVDLVRHRADRLGVNVELRVPEVTADQEVHGLRNEIGQAVLNLLVNALDALEEGPGEGGRIELWIEPGPLEIELGVRDDGPGVAEGELERVADLFYTTKEVGKGTGLGLALVHNTMAFHGGRVGLSSRPGEGFEVRLHFPRELPEDRA